jgi:anti-sigma factor RsiW
VNCSACSARLGAYQDGDLSAREMGILDAHLATCSACRAQLAQLRAVESSLVRLVAIEPQGDFTLALMAKIAAMPVPERRPVRLWWFVAADVLIWAAIGALTAFGAIRWKSLAGAAAAFAAKLGVALGTFYDVGQHFHITTVVALGVLLEVVFLALFAAAGRKYLSRVRATLSGVLS